MSHKRNLVLYVDSELIEKTRELGFDRSIHTLKGEVKIDTYHSCAMDIFFESDSSKDNIVQRRVYELVHDDFRRMGMWRW